MTVYLNGNNNFSYEKQAIPTTTKNTRTLIFARDFYSNDKLNSLKIDFERNSTRTTIKSIKIYYK